MAGYRIAWAEFDRMAWGSDIHGDVAQRRTKIFQPHPDILLHRASYLVRGTKPS